MKQQHIPKKIYLNITRKRIYEIVIREQDNDIVSLIYDRYIMVLIILSALPLMLKIWPRWVVNLDQTVTGLFVLDYFLRWITADFIPQFRKLPKWKAFLRDPFTFMAVIDLLALLPMILALPFLPVLPLQQYVQILRIMRVFRCFRFLKTVRYAKSFVYIYRAIKRERKLLIMVMLLALLYLFASAAFMFSVEPDTFNNFFESIYWAVAMLTTVGYGDIYPVTEAGRLVSIVSSFFGTAVIAMPAGIITAGFMEEINKVRFKDERKLEAEVTALLDEIKELRRLQESKSMEQQLEQLSAQMDEMKQSQQSDNVMLQDLSEDLKNALARGTIHAKEEPSEQTD